LAELKKVFPQIYLKNISSHFLGLSKIEDSLYRTFSRWSYCFVGECSVCDGK